uniref:Uncharacterized protein n=1 Tax=Rhizophora mucronata TaxID=61149 RepID=A0A2P2PCL0_RHIMU
MSLKCVGRIKSI